MKKWHDQLISNKEFQKGQRVLLYDTRLHIFPGKLKSRWIGLHYSPVYVNGVVELLNSNGKDTLESMDIVSSHSWSHSNQKRRKSTSLSHKKPKQKGGENAKKLKGSHRGAKTGVCEISQLCEISTSLRINVLCESAILCEIISQQLTPCENFRAANQVWHTSATSQHRSPHLQCETAAKLKRENSHFAPKLHSAGYFAIAKRFWHTSAISQHSDPI
ncbi:hypothetical protein CK203_105703 [Vitis vinifera]|uniref:Uncharacterized protein n=1 Tax=Vitis vinifera TaxID=29760 RepID=A0A438BPH3_VITVI|nr:hypothetical protein CK203_105703 [Vitis vinifera]